MKQEIIDLIAELEKGRGNYDPEIVHGRYDDLLEKFILNYEARLVPLMRKLIRLEKHFWYA